MRTLPAVLLLLLAAGPAAAEEPVPPDAAPPAKQAPGKWDGRWWGQYHYDDPSRPIVTFSVVLEPLPDGKFRGVVEENSSDFAPEGSPKKLKATVHGTYDDGLVNFLKVYDFDAGRQVEYRGVVVGDEVTGTWKIPGTQYGGTWFWKRAPRKGPTMPPPQ